MRSPAVNGTAAGHHRHVSIGSRIGAVIPQAGRGEQRSVAVGLMALYSCQERAHANKRRNAELNSPAKDARGGLYVGIDLRRAKDGILRNFIVRKILWRMVKELDFIGDCLRIAIPFEQRGEKERGFGLPRSDTRGLPV